MAPPVGQVEIPNRLEEPARRCPSVGCTRWSPQRWIRGIEGDGGDVLSFNDWGSPRDPKRSQEIQNLWDFWHVESESDQILSNWKIKRKEVPCQLGSSFRSAKPTYEAKERAWLQGHGEEGASMATFDVVRDIADAKAVKLFWEGLTPRCLIVA